MPQTLKIDFVSDISCPWCAIGLLSLQRAAAALQGAVVLDLHFQPFELNPAMAPEGQDMDEHLQEKYGASPEQSQRTREAIAARGAELGFVFRMDRRGRIYNTFDAHRLLHWAGTLGGDRQRALKHALLRAYFTDGADVSLHDVLVRVVGNTGLDPLRAREILASDEYADAVRTAQRHYASLGIRAVPSVILADKHLVQGGQAVETFERALRQAAGLA